MLLRLTYKNDITFTDLKDTNSIVINFNQQDFNYVINIKVILCTRSYLALTCKDQYYYQLSKLMMLSYLDKSLWKDQWFSL